jgi:hypothetical protein
MKLTGKRSAGNPHATFDEAEVGNVLITLSGAPVFDPTDEGELEIEHEATTPVLYSTEMWYPTISILPLIHKMPKTPSGSEILQPDGVL